MYKIIHKVIGQLHRHCWAPLDQIKNRLLWLPIWSHKDYPVPFMIKVEMEKLQEFKVKIPFLLTVCDHTGSGDFSQGP